jgi:SAM-dependent methyltransferase
MILCSDCRSPLEREDAACAACGWRPIAGEGWTDRLRSHDRGDPSLASYMDTYDTLAERNQSAPVESNRYVENLSIRFAQAIGEVRGKDVCDVGSGRGYLIKHLLAGGPRSVTAIDIAEPSLREVVERHGVIGVKANAEHLPYQDQFDVLAATDIVEHVLNVSNFFVTANWALRAGGLLAVRVPYLENILYYSNYHGLPVHYTHIRTFDRRTLVDLVGSFGFRVERVVYDGFNPNYPSALLRSMPATLRNGVVERLRSHFGGDDEVTRISPWLGRLLMKPIEVGVIARKVEHIVPVDAHSSFREFHDGRQARLAASAA